MLAALDGLGKIFDSIRANVYKEAMTAPTITVFVCLGSNTPDAAHMLSLAVERLRALPRARVDALSGIYLTELPLDPEHLWRAMHGLKDDRIPNHMPEDDAERERYMHPDD